MLAIMSSLAQEESRSISENVRWGQQKSMRDGKVFLPYKHFLGYKKGADGYPEIVEEEAAIVRQIYDMFLSGKSIRHIADYLTEQGVPTPTGKSRWPVSTVENILRNEKYKGEALLQRATQWTISARKRGKMTANCHNTTLRIRTNQLFLQRFSTLFRRSWSTGEDTRHGFGIIARLAIS